MYIIVEHRFAHPHLFFKHHWQNLHNKGDIIAHDKTKLVLDKLKGYTRERDIGQKYIITKEKIDVVNKKIWQIFKLIQLKIDKSWVIYV